MEEILGTSDQTLRQQANTVNLADAIKGVKVVFIYFSMHTCPPCREFTPLFTDLYKEYNENEKVFEVVFFSGDKNDQQYEEYYAEMPWLAVPRGDPRVATVAKKFEVRGVPRLIVLKPDGTVIDKDAVKKVTNSGPAAIDEYLSA